MATAQQLAKELAKWPKHQQQGEKNGQVHYYHL